MQECLPPHRLKARLYLVETRSLWVFCWCRHHSPYYSLWASKSRQEIRDTTWNALMFRINTQESVHMRSWWQLQSLHNPFWLFWRFWNTKSLTYGIVCYGSQDFPPSSSSSSFCSFSNVTQPWQHLLKTVIVSRGYIWHARATGQNLSSSRLLLPWYASEPYITKSRSCSRFV